MILRLTAISHRRAAAILTLLLAVGTLAAVSYAAPAEAAAPVVSVSRTAVIAGEPTTISGRLRPAAKRAVQLQVKVGARWRKIAATTSTKQGAFRFTAKPRATSAYRVFAPKVTKGAKRAAATSRTLTVTVAKQVGSAYRLPAVAAFGADPESSSNAQVVITSRFLPVRTGRTVALQRLTGSTWTTLATARQNTYGSAAFRLSSYPSGTLRATALASGGAPAFATSVVNRTWNAGKVNEEFSNPWPAALPSGWYHRQLDVYPGGKRQCSRTSADMVTITGGTAAISAQRDPVTDPDRSSICPNGTYRNGHIWDRDNLVHYGIAAARVKFQRKGGQHGAFWIQSMSGNLGSEIDVAEFFGEGRKDFGLNQYIHYADSTGKQYTSGTLGDTAYVTRTRQALGATGDDWWKNYHVFSVEWTPTAYIFRIDGVETFRTSKGLSNRAGTVILSNQTSDYELPANDGTKDTMYVDWVRTWTPG